MKVLRTTTWLALLLAVATLGACASDGVESDADRQARTLEDDNEALRNQLADGVAVEDALNRELTTKREDLDRANREIERLAGENDELTRQNNDLARRLRDATATPATTTPVSSRPSVDLGGLRGRDVEVAETDDGVSVRIAGTAMFATAQDTLTTEGKRILDRVADVLRSRPDVFISVEGHTDATPLGKSKAVWGTNLALSLARAMSVHDYLKRTKRIPEQRMRVVGWGEHRPLAPGSSREANAKNRRVELVLSQSDG